MKVLLVRTARIKQAITLGEFMYSEPLGLEMIYSLLEEKHQVEILDLMSERVRIEDKLKEFQPQVVGITSLCIDVVAVNQLAAAVKAYDPNIITLVGGTQAYFNKEGFFIDAVDHVMKYTTRKNLLELFRYLEGKETPPLIDGIYSKCNQYKSTDVYGTNEYITPNRGSTAKYRNKYSYFGYRPAAIMGTAQGCGKTCRFCLRWRLEGHRENYFPMESVKAEIRSIKEDTIMVIDNDFLHNGQRIKELCDFLREEKIKKNFI